VPSPCPDDDRGSSLIELVVAMSLFSLLLVTSLTMIFSTTSSSQNTGWRASTEPILRDALDAALGEVRSAAPLPVCAMPIGEKDVNACRRVDQNLSGAAVDSASATSLCVYTNKPSPGGAATVVRQPLWKTCLTTTSGILSAAHYAPTGTVTSTPTLIDSSYSGTATDTARLADTPAVFSFEYRDITQTVIATSTLSTHLADIASVTITATATRTSPTGTQTDSVSVSTSLRPRLYGGS
jgi:Tfp pilus assembly protein PilW